MLCGWAPACSEARKKTLTDTLVVRPLVHIYIWSLKKWSHWINHVASLVVNYSPDSPLPSLLVGRWDKYLVDTCHWNDCSLTCSQTIHMARLTWGTFFFWLHWKTCKILVPWLGIELVPSAMKAWRPNHWTTREFSFLRHFFIYLFLIGRGLCCCMWVFSSCGPRASHCSGFSCCGSWARAHRLSCPEACGIFPDQGLNLCPLHCQADS